jgi:hypothetical protein
MTLRITEPNPNAGPLLSIDYLPIEEFVALDFHARIHLFMTHLGHEIVLSSLTPAVARHVGEAQLSNAATNGSRYSFNMFELDIRFACQERVGSPMTAEMYQQLVLPLLSAFFMSQASTRVLIDGVSERAIQLFSARVAGEPKAPCCNIVVRPV